MINHEKVIKEYFQAWIDKDIEKLNSIFADDIIYSECYGPEYHGLDQIIQWFSDWNVVGTVLNWSVKQFFHQGNTTIVEWFFNCHYNGEDDSFDGVSIVIFDSDGRIKSLKEFQSQSEHYYPYEKDDDIVLVSPTEEYEAAADMMKQEFFDYGETVMNGSALLDQLDYKEWLEHVKKYQDAGTVGDDWVLSSTFFALCKDTGNIVGMIDIRHHIQHPFLSEYGGHIGYCVRPSERCKGYGTKMLELGLNYARMLGLEKVMLGCYSDNVGSIKMIERCGGKLFAEKPYLDGKPVCIYWITLTTAIEGNDE